MNKKEIVQSCLNILKLSEQTVNAGLDTLVLKFNDLETFYAFTADTKALFRLSKECSIDVLVQNSEKDPSTIELVLSYTNLGNDEEECFVQFDLVY